MGGADFLIAETGWGFKRAHQKGRVVQLNVSGQETVKAKPAWQPPDPPDRMTGKRDSPGMGNRDNVGSGG